jgi:ubiquinone/menaquinone biosynthesis C-methylase UbiE
MYRFFIPEGLRILELGCGCGHLLAALKPIVGVGVDFSSAMLNKARSAHPALHFVEADAHNLQALSTCEAAAMPFDMVILSDIINDIWDLRIILSEIRRFCSPSTRIVLNFHSHLWEYPMRLAQRMGWVTQRMEQNWFTPDDVANLAYLAGFEEVRRRAGFLWPWKTPLLGSLCNRWLSQIFPFSCFSFCHFMVLRPFFAPVKSATVSVVIPARNEAGNIENAIQRVPPIGDGVELVFVEGNSTDDTWDIITNMKEKYPDKNIVALRQDGKGKGDAVRKGFDVAAGDILMILDADLTVPPEALPQFYEDMISGRAEFVNGVRLVYPQENKAMRFCNLVANKFFSLAFSWLLGRSIKDTLCGTKVLWKRDYQRIAADRKYFGDFDPFGDYDLIFGASKQNLMIRDLPIRYRERVYGDTNINRWRDGLLLLRMVVFAAKRIRFV